MKTDNLEQRAVAALSTDGVSVTELAELIREVEAALPAAYAAAEEVRREGADPLLSPDPVVARERVIAAELAYDRLGSLLSRLETRHRQLAAAERATSFEADYERVKAERDGLAVELDTTYPQVVATLVDLVVRVAECDKECARVAGTAPSGEKRRLLGPELHAKGLTGFTRDTPSITRDLRLPDWKEPATTAWPQRRREVLTFAPGCARSAADWWRAGEARSR
jgi:hypothetical protein